VSARGGGDAVERLLREARLEAPRGLAARLARGALDPDAAARIFWLDFSGAARPVIRIAIAAAVLAIALAIGLTRDRGSASRAGASADASDLDDVAQLALAPDSFVGRVERDVAHLPRSGPAPGRGR
jgi:hypothetical protein